MIPPSRDDSLLATHPSDHNSIYISGMSHGMRQKRLIKVQKRRARDLTKVKAGKLDEKTYKRGNVHDNAFLVPVPMYYTLGYIGYAGACGSVRLYCFLRFDSKIYHSIICTGHRKLYVGKCRMWRSGCS